MAEQDEIPDLDTMERGLVVIGSMGAFFTGYAVARGATEIAGDLKDAFGDATDIVSGAAGRITKASNDVLSFLGKGRKGGIL